MDRLIASKYAPIPSIEEKFGLIDALNMDSICKACGRRFGEHYQGKMKIRCTLDEPYDTVFIPESVPTEGVNSLWDSLYLTKQGQ